MSISIDSSQLIDCNRRTIYAEAIEQHEAYAAQAKAGSKCLNGELAAEAGKGRKHSTQQRNFL